MPKVEEEEENEKNRNNLGIVEVYFTNEKGEKIKATEPDQTVFLHIITENMKGKCLNINLCDDVVDFLYQGEWLENDQIKKLPIYADETIIELRTIKQKEL